MEIFANGQWLPLIFMVLMGVSVLAYVILDGYDLGVGILMSRANDAEKDRMIATIGPFWDANETWLVLGIGILLVAFPVAHGVILTALYLPTALMLGGLILRGVSFDFRAKAKAQHKHFWDKAFVGGSVLASLAQGYMLGAYILGFDRAWNAIRDGNLSSLISATVLFFLGTTLIKGFAVAFGLGVLVSMAVVVVVTRVFLFSVSGMHDGRIKRFLFSSGISR